MARGTERLTKQERDELLSAYLDGEMEAEEQACAEAQLADDPQLQSELEALRRTVEMVRELPTQPVPRNFILPQTAATRSRPTPAARPRRSWTAPLLTAATALASLLFVVVLAGDLLLSGSTQMASMPAADEQKLGASQPVAEGEKEKVETEKEKPVAPAPSTPPGAADDEAMTPSPAAVAEETLPTPTAIGTPPPTPTPPGTYKAGSDDEENGTDKEGRAPKTESPASGGGSEIKSTDTPMPALPVPPAESSPPAVAPAETPAPTLAPTAAPEETLAPTALPTLQPSDEHVRGTESSESATEPVEKTVETGQEDEGDIPRHGVVWLSPLRVSAIGLGVVALGLALATVLAWRARRH
jgi:hypothetical protein